ncbi:hypothetical protein ACQJBY_040317 [Aegilops geniculata]
MPGLAAAEQDAVSLVRRVARALNRRISDLVALLFRHKSAGSFGAVAGFAIAVVFAWKFLRSSSTPRPRRPAAPKRPSAGAGSAAASAPDGPAEPAGDSGTLTTRQIVARRLGGCRRVAASPGSKPPPPGSKPPPPGLNAAAGGDTCTRPATATPQHQQAAASPPNGRLHGMGGRGSIKDLIKRDTKWGRILYFDFFLINFLS